MPEETARRDAVESRSDAASQAYVPESDDIISGHQFLADKYKSDLDQRRSDYESGKRRDSSSYAVLKDIALSIVDGDRAVVAGDLAANARQVQADSAKPAESGVIGYAGDRPKDPGMKVLEKPEVVKDSYGNVSQFRMPDGTQFEVDYTTERDGTRTPMRIILPDEDGRPRNIMRVGDKWVYRDDPSEPTFIKAVRLESDGSVTVVQDGYATKNEATGKTIIHHPRMFKFNSDGTYKETDMRGVDLHQTFEKDGTYHKYSLEQRGDTLFRKEAIQEPGSHIREVREGAFVGGTEQYERNLMGYELIDDQGHTTSIVTASDGSANVVRGDKVEHFDHHDRDANGTIRLSNNDKSSLEISKDGTQIRRDSKGHVTEIINSDGEKTTFKRTASGAVTEVKLFDGQGNEVKSDKPTRVVKLDDQDGSYVIERDKYRNVERKADGTERLLDKTNKPVDGESDADKLLAKFKNFTPEQQHQLRQDLADIDKLPEAQRKQIYESLDRIARNDEHPEQHIRLTGQQARELVASLAHQIAHPEAIRQGCKQTCVVASAEQTLARNNPAAYADMVSRLATDGEYKAADGTVVRVQGYDKKALEDKSDAYGQRSYASELFQNAGAQLALDKNKEYVSYGPFDYGRIDQRPQGVKPSSDTGERVIDKNFDPPKVTAFDGLVPEEEQRLLNRIVPGGGYKPTNPVSTVEDLGAAARQNGVPLMASIHLGKERFTGMSGSEGASLSGYHAVTITHIDYDKYNPDGTPAKDAKPVKVYFENTAGGTDHSYPHGKGVDAQEFVDAMQSGKFKMRAMVKDKRTI